jgi:hypothetical protein
MFRNVFQSAASTRVFAGAAMATAGLTGSTIVWANTTDEEVSSSSMSVPYFFTLHNPFAPHVAQCEEAPSNATVIGLLQELTKKVTNMETIIGGRGAAGVASTTKGKRKHGIDIVLGAQWGDEGKGKLVDMLSQVRVFLAMKKKNKIVIRALLLWSSVLLVHVETGCPCFNVMVVDLHLTGRGGVLKIRRLPVYVFFLPWSRPRTVSTFVRTFYAFAF